MNNEKTSHLKSLEQALLSTLDLAGMIVCVKNTDKLVTHQNQACISLCGKREGEICNDGCMEVYNADNEQQWQEWGNRTYKNCHLHDDMYDLTLLCTEQHIVSILQPLKDKQKEALEYYQNIGLSKRETQVIAEAINGLSNAQMCEKLFISPSTLRTHLNNIYAKVKAEGATLKHIPALRSQAS